MKNEHADISVGRSDGLKILMLIPNLDFGGAQRVFHQHATLLSQKFKIVECTFNMDYGHAYPTANTPVSLNVPAGTNMLSKSIRFIQRCLRLYKLKKTERPVITISHLEGADYVSLLSFGKDKKILIVHGSKIHDHEISNSFGWLRMKVLLPLLYRRADLIVTVSEGIRKELRDQFKIPSKKIVTVYNFFSVQKILSMGQQQAMLNQNNLKPLRIITSGRLVQQKNQLPLIHILSTLVQKYGLQVQLFIAGDGPMRDQLVSECKNLQLSIQECSDLADAGKADVIFLGYQSNVYALYQYMQLFVFPSAWEGFPLALGEAMIMDIPVLSSDCPTGPLELLAPDMGDDKQRSTYPIYASNGVLLPIPQINSPATIEMWAKAIAHALSNEDLMNGMKASARKRMQLLDEENVKNEWFRIIEQIAVR